MSSEIQQLEQKIGEILQKRQSVQSEWDRLNALQNEDIVKLNELQKPYDNVKTIAKTRELSEDEKSFLTIAETEANTIRRRGEERLKTLNNLKKTLDEMTDAEDDITERIEAIKDSELATQIELEEMDEAEEIIKPMTYWIHFFVKPHTILACQPKCRCHRQLKLKKRPNVFMCQSLQPN